jgi:quercetin dioxygenase-like cupin family protein
MKIFHGDAVPHQPVDPASFVGAAQAQKLAEAQDGTPVIVYRVEFEPGARTNWHRHSGAQWLLIVEGRIRIQKWGDGPQEIGAGDAVMIAPGEKHWHGAASGVRGVHLAVNVNATTEWLERVTDEDYVRT